MLGIHWAIVGRLHDIRDELFDSGDERYKLIDEVLDAPRVKRRLMLRAAVAEIERRAVRVDFYGDGVEDVSDASSILDLIQWLLDNVPAIIELIEKIISLFQQQED